MTPPSRIRVLIVDDHCVVREGLRSMIRREPNIIVAGEAANGVKAVEAFDSLLPDVTIMDLRMPVLSGIEAIEAILRKHPEARVLVLSSFEGDEDIHVALDVGAMGYLLKHSSREQIIPAIRALMQGKQWIPSDVAARLAARGKAGTLTFREREIMHLVASGLANKQVAAVVGLTEGTVKCHIKNILGKLRVPDRTAAVTVALRRGIIHFPES